MSIYALGDQEPDIHPDAYVHPDATVIGQVTLGAWSSVWPGAVLRGDDGAITVGERSSIQDGSVVHATHMLNTHIGNSATIGHMVHLEGCVVEDRALVGNGAVVLHRAIIRSHSLVGSNAVVPNGMEVPTGAMALGIPAKLRESTVAEGSLDGYADTYVARIKTYRDGLRRLS